MIKTFEVEVVQTTTVTVEIDDAVWNEQRMADFRKDFYQFQNLEQHARHLAQYAVRFGSPKFMEGYGPMEYKTEFGNRKPEGSEDTGVVLTVGDEDLEIETLSQK